MNAVRNYEGILNFLREKDNRRHWVPVLLIKPHTIIGLMKESRGIEVVFDYYDRRTGPKRFFLAGYKNRYCPNTTSSQDTEVFFSPVFSTPRLSEVYYSNEAFVGFLDDLGKRIPGFRYYGDTELLMLKYDPQAFHGRGEFIENEYHRYNLSRLGNADCQKLNRFLEETIDILKEEDDCLDTIYKVDKEYLRSCKGTHDDYVFDMAMLSRGQLQKEKKSSIYRQKLSAVRKKANSRIK